MTPNLNAVDERILILAPLGQDAALAVETLDRAGLTAVACADMSGLLDQAAEGAGALLLTEEALTIRTLEQLKTALSAQPVWSDLPVILLAGSGQRSLDYGELMRHLQGNITILQRPVSVASLITVAQTALRARRRQYETRALLVRLNNQNERLALEVAERKQVQTELRQLANNLEQQVAKRTTELQAMNQSLRKEILERQTIEKKLDEERQLLRTLIDTAPVYIFVKDIAGRFILVNDRTVRLLGLDSEAELLNKTDFNFFPEVVAAGYHTDDQVVIQSGQPLVNREEPLTDADGNHTWISYTKVPLKDAKGGQVTGILGVAWDITHRREMEQRLRASEARFRKIFEEGPLGMGIIDQSYRFVQVNARLCRMLEYSKAELVGRSPFEFTHPDDVAADQNLVDQIFGGLISDFRLEKRYITKTGKTIWGMLTVTLIQAKQKEEIFELGMLEDITEEKRVEQERLALLAEISQQRDQLRNLSARLAEVQERERQHLVRELHDQVGQTLTALNFNLGFVRSQIVDDLPATAAIRHQLARAIELVAVTTDRIRNVMAELRPPLLDESGLFDALTWYTGHFEAWTGLNVLVNARPMSPRLAPATENALFRITQEALNNVAKHAQARQVTLSLRADDQTVRLVIVDDGTGFDRAALPNGANDGGWGIRTMTERAEMIHGKCQIESWPGQGTRVQVEVPRTLEGDEARRGGSPYEHHNLSGR